MLESLHVKNLALVDDVHVEFGPGLNVITGETGAGKSILVGALLLVLGDRADKSVLRTGAEACTAQAVFRGDGLPGLDTLLEELGLAPCEDGQLIVRRVVRATGTNQNFINDQPVTVQALRRLGERLVDLHGPHDHQSLLDTRAQLDLLDAYGKHREELAHYGEVFERRRALDAELEELEGQGDEGVAEQIDLLSYRLREIEDAAPEPAEEQALLEEHLTLANAQEIRSLGAGVAEALVEADGSAFDSLAAAQRALEELVAMLPEAAAWRDELRSAIVQVQELHAAVSRRVEEVEADPARLQWVEERMAVYDKLKRKYGGSVESVMETRDRARERLASLSGRGERLAVLRKEREEADGRLREAGAALRKQRVKAAKRLAAAITTELRQLGFADGAFSVELSDAEPRASGMDAVEFGFAPNPGEAMRPLRTIASSGEISRVMLATKVVLAGLDRIPVLAFDEVDANVGGEMGRVVGAMLARLAEGHQVLCITHLPQTAVHGNRHLAVEKTVQDGRTFTRVRPLEGPERVAEIARMLGGAEATGVAARHAREMLKLAAAAR